MKNYSGSVGKIESFSTVDGPGIRSAVFLTGCTLRCIYCHNPEFLEKEKNNMTPEMLASKLINNKAYFKNGGGVTFSGGEPLLQCDFLIETCKFLKKENIHVALDTAGVGKYNEDIFNYINLVILDIKGSNKEDYKTISGFDRFEETIDFLKTCESKNTPVIIRQVIVPGINDTKENILKLKKLVEPFKNVLKIELLGYHNMAIDKYKKLGRPYALNDIKSLATEKLEELKSYL